MFISRFFIISAACLLLAIAGLSAAQQYTDNSVNEQQGDSFDYEEQQQPAVATPTRFQSKPQASSFRSRTTFSSAAQPQAQAPRAPPVQILKQINRHNEDGSYTYGFEGSDGSFKIETKLANGEVKGKYGYVDDSGKVRVVEYGANKYGFQPAGEGITVAPPTLVDESKVKKNKKVPATGGQLAQFIPVNEEVPEYDDGQYYEQPQPQQQVPVRSSQRSGPAVRPRARPAVAAPVQAAPAHIPRPSANFEFGTSQDFSGYQEQQSFQGRSSSGPVPPPAQIPGAIPVPSNEGSAQRIVVPGSNFVTSSRSASAQQVRPAPQFLFQQSAPSQERQAPRAAARNFPSSGSSSSFDELEKQFALPSGGSPPTHDISFSAYF